MHRTPSPSGEPLSPISSPPTQAFLRLLQPTLLLGDVCLSFLTLSQARFDLC